MNNQEKRIKVFVNNSQDEDYLVLTYSENRLSFDKKVIEIDSIDHVDLSLCCSKGEDGRYYCIYNLYFVFLDVITKDGTYLFQLMNNDKVKDLFEFLLVSNIKINDPLELIDAYEKITDSVELYNHFNRHFKDWKEKYNLEINNFYYSVIENDYMRPLQNLDPEDMPNFKEQLKQVFDGYINIFKKISINKSIGGSERICRECSESQLYQPYPA